MGGEWRVVSATPLCNGTRAVPLWRSEAKGFSALLSACIRGLILKGISEPFGYGMWAVGERTVFFFSASRFFGGKGWFDTLSGHFILLVYSNISPNFYPLMCFSFCALLSEFTPNDLGLLQADWFVRDNQSNDHSSMNVSFFVSRCLSTRVPRHGTFDE